MCWHISVGKLVQVLDTFQVAWIRVACRPVIGRCPGRIGRMEIGLGHAVITHYDGFDGVVNHTLCDRIGNKPQSYCQKLCMRRIEEGGASC